MVLGVRVGGAHQNVGRMKGDLCGSSEVSWSEVVVELVVERADGCPSKWW